MATHQDQGPHALVITITGEAIALAVIFTVAVAPVHTLAPAAAATV